MQVSVYNVTESNSVAYWKLERNTINSKSKYNNSDNSDNTNNGVHSNNNCDNSSWTFLLSVGNKFQPCWHPDTNSLRTGYQAVAISLGMGCQTVRKELEVRAAPG